MHRKVMTLVAAAVLVHGTAVIHGSAFGQDSPKPTDPQIAHIAYTAGVIDIEAAKQALAKTKNKDVRAFAEDMARDHEAVNKQALDLCKKLNVTPADNDTSKSLVKAAEAKRAELAKLSGAAFDKAYINNEVAYHKTVNGALETLLIPSASNGELKALLQTGLKLFQGHQQHAEHLAASMGKSPEMAMPHVVKITIANMTFTPALASVRAGDTIEWTNADVVDHTATASNHAWDVSIAAGKTGRATVTKAGHVDYYCKFHPNMHGEVTAQ
jgi:putative membrane protein